MAAMRKLVWVALAALLCFFSLLLILDFEKGKMEGGAKADSEYESGDFHIGAYSSQAADFEGGTVAVIRGFVLPQEDARVSVFCQEAPIQKNALIVRHPTVAGVDPSLSDELASALSRSGLSSREVSLESALEAKDALIFLPTGALPEGIAASLNGTSGKNSRIVLFESLAGKMIGENGSLSPLPEGLAADFEKVRLEPGGGKEAAADAAKLALLPKGANVVGVRANGGNFTAVVPMNGSVAHCRALYSGNTSWRFADTAEIAAPGGRLRGEGRVPAGKRASFEFLLSAPEESGRNLTFHALLKNDSGEVARQKIAEGKVSGEIGGSFAFSFPRGGAHVVDVVDQFGRVHASAFVEALEISAVLVLQEGSRHQFRAELGDEPLNGAVEAWIDGGERKVYYANNGTLVVWAAPTAGAHEMHFAKGGFAGAYPFTYEGGGLAHDYARLGIPAALLLASAYFLLRAGRKAKYRITFPQAAIGPQRAVPVSERTLQQAWERADGKMGGFCLAHYPEEIAREIPGLLGEKGRADAQSVRCALFGLSERGVFCESEGAFAPACKMRGFSAQDLRALRVLHDALLEKGVRFERKRLLRAGEGLEVLLFSGKGSVLSKIGKRRRLVVFGNEAEMREFEKSLGSDGAENTRIKLAKSLGKLAFAVASKNGLGRHLL